MGWSLRLAGCGCLLLVTASGSPAQSDAKTSTFLALAGAEARELDVPDGFRLERWGALPHHGLRWRRYQQYQGGIPVLGAELTLYRDEGGEIVLAIGDAYPRIRLANRLRVALSRARRRAERDIGRGGEWRSRLTIDPETRRLFHRLENRRFASQWHFWVDAGDGRLLRRYNGLTTSEGIGVKGDVKDLTGLTTSSFGGFLLRSEDGRQTIRDARSRPSSQLVGAVLPAFLLGRIASDADDQWVESGRASPGQAALVDAAYYTAVADLYYRTVHGRDGVDGKGRPIVAVAHFSEDFNNAFWNARNMVFGDGDGQSFAEFSGALDIVAHELTHGVTQHTSALIYFGQPGALNESLSDIIGNSVEFFADARGLDPTGSPDWLVSEDIDLRSDAVPGFRNMGDPAEDGDPDHYSELRTGFEDNGGVHTNSAIPNHAFYLLVNGGVNAGEARGHDHSGPVVTGIGLAEAEQIFYLGFTSLPLTANMCRARLATEAVAAALFPASHASVVDAWDAVGVPGDC